MPFGKSFKSKAEDPDNREEDPDKRRTLKGLFAFGLLGAGTFLTGCDLLNTNPLSSPDSEPVPTPELTPIELLEKETWTKEELIQYLSLIGLGTIYIYDLEGGKELPAGIPEDMKLFLAALDRGDYMNYKQELLGLFDPKSNLEPTAKGYFVPNAGLADPITFRSQAIRKSDGSVPRSWEEIEFMEAVQGLHQTTRFGGRTYEYLPGERVITGLDLRNPANEIIFLGECRESKKVALLVKTAKGQELTILAPRNIVFPRYNADRGYLLINPQNNEATILTHLLARHPITPEKFSGLYRNLLSQTDHGIQAIILGAREGYATQIAVKEAGAEELYYLILRSNPARDEALRSGNIQEFLRLLRMMGDDPDVNIITAYQQHDSLAGSYDDGAKVLKQLWNLESIPKGSAVFYTLPDGTFTTLPNEGSLLARWLPRIRNMTDEQQYELRNMILQLIEKRPELEVTMKLSASILGIALGFVFDEAMGALIQAVVTMNSLQDLSSQAKRWTILSDSKMIGHSTVSYVPEAKIPIGAINDPPDMYSATKIGGTPAPTPEEVLFTTTAFNGLSHTLDPKEIQQQQLALSTLSRGTTLNTLNEFYAALYSTHGMGDLGVAALPTAYGQKPQELAVVYDPEKGWVLCIYDYNSSNGIGRILGGETTFVAHITELRDIVDSRGSFQQAAASLTDQEVNDMGGFFKITYSIKLEDDTPYLYLNVEEIV